MASRHKPMATAATLLAALAATTGSGCSYYADPGRGPTAVVQAEFAGTALGLEGRELDLTIAACNAAPAVSFVEDDDEVVISVEAQLPGRDGDDCADGAAIVLDEPLGQRPLIDASTGAPIPIINPETGTPITADAGS